MTIAYTNWGASGYNCPGRKFGLHFLFQDKSPPTRMQDGGERKRDRSDESCDEPCDVSNESEMTTAQMQTCKKLTANASKYQGLSFDPTTRQRSTLRTYVVYLRQLIETLNSPRRMVWSLQASDASHAPFATRGTVRCFPIGMHSEFINGFVNRFVWCALHTKRCVAISFRHATKQGLIFRNR